MYIELTCKLCLVPCVSKMAASCDRICFQYVSVRSQGFIQDFRLGAETQHLGGSGSMFPQEMF